MRSKVREALSLQRGLEHRDPRGLSGFLLTDCVSVSKSLLFSTILSASGVISMCFGRVETQRDPWHAMGSMEVRRDKSTGLFRDMREYQFPLWEQKNVTYKKTPSFVFCTNLSWEQSSSLSQACNVENPPHQLILAGRGLWGTLRDLPAKAAPVWGAGSVSLVKHKFCTWLQFPCFVPQGYLSALASAESLTGSLAILIYFWTKS